MFTILFRDRITTPGRFRCDADRGQCPRAATWRWRVGPVEACYCSWHDMGERIAQDLARNEVLTVVGENL